MLPVGVSVRRNRFKLSLQHVLLLLLLGFILFNAASHSLLALLLWIKRHYLADIFLFWFLLFSQILPSNMLQSFAQSQDWLYSEPLLFDDEFCQSLMKDLQSLPTPPQSPPMKAGLGASKPLSKEDQLSYVSDILLEDHDMQLSWNYDFFHSEAAEKEGEPSQPCSPLEESSEDCLWQCLAVDKSLEEKLVSTVLGSSPLLSDIDTSIFEEIAGSTLDCQNLMDTQESSEATSDYGSTGGEMSNYSSSDSGEYRSLSVYIHDISPQSGSSPVAKPNVVCLKLVVFIFDYLNA